jgi:hypothetical protein
MTVRRVLTCEDSHWDAFATAVASLSGLPSDHFIMITDTAIWVEDASGARTIPPISRSACETLAGKTDLLFWLSGTFSSSQHFRRSSSP